MRAITALYVARTLLQEAPSLASPAPAPAGEQCSCEEAGLSAGLTAAYVLICITLIVLAGMMAGLTLGKARVQARALLVPHALHAAGVAAAQRQRCCAHCHRLCLNAGLLSIDK